MSEYFHSVTLDRDACKGCITCVKRCPTEAIRVRGGKAKIIKERCIDCGECIRVCPHHAKRAVTDSLSDLERFAYTVALPPPSLFGQFNHLEDTEILLDGLKLMGFDAVYEVSRGAELVSDATRRLLRAGALKRPVISSACPAVLRMIRVRFPQLIGNILHLRAPVEVAARLARREAMERTGLSSGEIGVVFLTPCPAKVTAARSPMGAEASGIDLTIGVSEIYPPLLAAMNALVKPSPETVSRAGRTGIAWGRSGGEASATLHERYLAADGMENVIKVLEEMEGERLGDVDFVELSACPAGCVGGVLNIENPYLAATRLKKLGRYRPVACSHIDGMPLEELAWETGVAPADVIRLDPSPMVAMEMLGRMEEIEKRLYHLDCGSCGAPSCRALAEDIVRGYSHEDACIYVLKEKMEAVQGSLTALRLGGFPKKEDLR